MDLSNATISANVPVSDMNRALQFYGETLGLQVVPINDWLNVVVGGGGSTLTLSLRNKVPSDEDTANFTVTDIRATITELKSRGVQFHDYDDPNLKTDNHVTELGGFQAAWFKDSEGNTLNLNQSPAAST